MNRLFPSIPAALVLALSLIGFGLQTQAQLEVETGLTLEEYVNEVLLGNGIQAFNITYQGGFDQLGYLEGADDSFGIPSGLLMSTGAATEVAQPGDDGSCGFGTGCTDCQGMGVDNDLLDIANSVPAMINEDFTVADVNDLSVLEFDFIAAGDSVRFNYLFGSVEYPVNETACDYINSSFNDVFAFFLSGPGITGIYDSPAGFPDGAVNIAGVPGTDPLMPITVSSVNAGCSGTDAVNEEYFVVDFDGNNDENIACGMDGFTVPLVAEHEVICGETYHIKLAIADGTDGALSSIVLLEEGSFESNAVVQINLSIDVGGPEANTIYEDCGLATLTFERPVETVLEIQEMVYIDYGNSEAINGVDYGQPQPDGTLLPLPDSVVFAPFVSLVEFELSAAIDGIAEGPELVEMQIENVAACNGGGLTTYFTFYVAENPPPFEVSDFSTTICQGQEVEAGPIVTGGYGNYTFDWDCPEGNDAATYLLSPDEDWSCFVSVADTCDLADSPIEVEVAINVLQLPPLEVSIDQLGPLVLECSGSASLTSTASGGDGVYSYDWTDEEGVGLAWWPMSNIDIFTWMGVEEVFLTLTDGCGFEVMDSIEVEYNIPPIEITVEESVDVLCNDPFTVTATADGTGPFFYTWFNGNNWLDFDATLNWQTSADASLVLEVSDNCGQTESANVEIIVEAPDVEVSLPQGLVGPCTEVFDLTANVTSGSGGYQYSWLQNGINMNESDASIDVQLGESATISVNVDDGCGQSGTASSLVTIDNPPLVVELGPDIYASCVDFTPIAVDVISGAGGYAYDWFVSGEPYDQGSDITLQSYGTVPVSVSVTDGCGGADNDSLVYHIPDIPLSVELTPSTTICAGDGISLEVEAMGGEEGFVYYWPTLDAYGPVQYIAPLQTAVYPVVATDICGEEIDASTNIEVQYLFSDFVASMSETDENRYTFRATPTPEEPFPGAYSYDWDFGDGNSSDEAITTHVFDGLSDYTVTLDVTSSVGCTNQAYTVVRGPVLLYVPTAFTPNNDGINDAFKVVGSQIMNYELWIMNRWGETVFHSTSLDDVWVGDVQGGTHYAENGIYNWIIRLKGYNTDAEEYTGTLQLMR